ncbi:MAG: hypothetical protein PHU51_02185 [Candidatus Nanoarchaeia archaeon]|nr:hypothetical protein [Candidatus Nanoarchaeia archaeon]
MGEVKENSNANRDFLIAVIVLFGIWGYKHFEKNPIDWSAVVRVAILSLLCLLFITSIIIAIISIYRHKRRKKEEFAKIKGEFQDLVKHLPSTLEKCNEKFKQLEKYAELFHEEVKKAKIDVNIRIKEIKEKINQEKEEDRREAERERKKWEKEQRLKQIENQQINKIFEYFKEQKNNESIPEWALEFDSRVIDRASEKYRTFEYNSKLDKKHWNQICKFVLETEGYPTHFNAFDKEEQELYLKAIQLKKEGKLKLQEEDVYGEVDKELLEKKFYFYNELSIKDRDLLTTKCGYRHKSFIFLDGRSGNKVLIKNDNPSESDNHFCKKYLIASIDNSMSQVEYGINGQRTDVMFSVAGLKFAVEIETGTNKDIQIQRKVDWLNKHFDYWIIICPRKEKTKYKKFVDGKKSYCHTLKEGVEFIQSIINPS